MEILYFLYWVLSSFQILALTDTVTHNTSIHLFLYLFVFTHPFSKIRSWLCYSVPILGNYLGAVSFNGQMVKREIGCQFEAQPTTILQLNCFVILKSLLSLCTSVFLIHEKEILLAPTSEGFIVIITWVKYISTEERHIVRDILVFTIIIIYYCCYYFKMCTKLKNKQYISLAYEFYLTT